MISLFEQQQERIPPSLLAERTCHTTKLPWAAPFSVQAQLKRLADSVGKLSYCLYYGAICLGLLRCLFGLKIRTLSFTASSEAAGWVDRSVLEAPHYARSAQG